MHSGTPSYRIGFLLGLMILTAAALGCSGGGGGGGGGGSDTTPPQVDTVAPANGTTDITLDVDISATFNEAMDGTTINLTSMTISPAVAGSVAYDATAQRATFNPTAALTASTTYTVTITTACTDTAGNAMAADYVWSFTTGTTSVNEWTQVGGQVSPGGDESEDPTMMIVNSSPAVGYRHFSHRVYLNSWDGSSWGSSVTDPSGGNMVSSIYHTPAFCSNEDTIYMAYSRDGVDPGDAGFYTRIFVYQWTVGGGYTIMNSGGEISIPWNAVDGGANAWEPAIGCYDSDLPWVAYVESDIASGSDDHAWGVEMTGTSSSRTNAIDRNSSAGSYATDVRTVGILQDSNDCAYVAQWESHHNEQDQTDLYVSYTCGTTSTALGGAVTDDWDYNNLSKPSMAWYDGKLHIAYTRANPSDGTKHVYVKAFNSGPGTWTTVSGGPVSAFSAANHYDSANPDLLVADGTLYVAWEESDVYDGPFVYVAYYDPGTTSWVIDGDQLNVDTGRQAGDPSLAYNADDGYLYVAFEENVSSTIEIFVKRKRHIP